jgi:hypothetical protein
MKKFLTDWYVIISSLILLLLCELLLSDVQNNTKASQLPIYKIFAFVLFWICLLIFLIGIILRIKGHFSKAKPNEPSNTPVKLGTSVSDMPKLLSGALKTWQGWAGLVIMVVVGVLAPENLKVPLVFISGVPLWATGMRIAAHKLSQKQIAQIETPQVTNTQQQPSTENWQTPCFVRADNLAPFPTNWAKGQLIYDVNGLTWKQSSLLDKAEELTINISHQSLKVIQSREPEGLGEANHFQKGIFKVLECQSNSTVPVLLAVQNEFVDLVSQALNGSQANTTPTPIVQVYQG